MTDNSKPTNVRVEYTIGVTVPTGGFSNVKPEYTLSADVPDDTHPSVVRDKLKGLADKWIQEDVDQIAKEANS